MNNQWGAFRAAHVVPLRNRDYYIYLRYRIKKAQSRIWASIFIVDVEVEHDVRREIRELLRDLSVARFRGVDVRVMTGFSRAVLGLTEVNLVARYWLRLHGVLSRSHQPKERTSMHEKFVLIDEDWVLLGSHNWTARAFSENDETSVAVRSPDVVRKLEAVFLESWERRPVREAAHA